MLPGSSCLKLTLNVVGQRPVSHLSVPLKTRTHTPLPQIRCHSSSLLCLYNAGDPCCWELSQVDRARHPHKQLQPRYRQTGASASVWQAALRNKETTALLAQCTASKHPEPAVSGAPRFKSSCFSNLATKLSKPPCS